MESFDQKVLRKMIEECKDNHFSVSIGLGNVEVDGKSCNGYSLWGDVNRIRLCASVWNKRLLVIYKDKKYSKIKDVPDEKVRQKLHEWLDAWL